MATHPTHAPIPKEAPPAPTPHEEEGTVPHPGGANAKVGSGAFSGGCVPEAAPPPPEEDAHAKKK